MQPVALDAITILYMQERIWSKVKRYISTCSECSDVSLLRLLMGLNRKREQFSCMRVLLAEDIHAVLPFPGWWAKNSTLRFSHRT
jgi:hypothetical protein